MSRLRTIISVWVLCTEGLVGLVVCATMQSDDLAKSLYASFTMLLGAAVLALSGKSLGEHAVKGAGIRGALKTLMTDAKPGDPQSQPPTG